MRQRTKDLAPYLALAVTVIREAIAAHGAEWLRTADGAWWCNALELDVESAVRMHRLVAGPSEAARKLSRGEIVRAGILD